MHGRNFPSGQVGDYSLPPPTGAVDGAPPLHCLPHGSSTLPPAAAVAPQTAPDEADQASVQGKTHNGIDIDVLRPCND